MKPRISMITLGVSNLARSIEFYEKGLGLPRLDSPPSVAFFNLEGSWLGLYERTALAEDANLQIPPAQDASFPGFSLSHNLASTEEVDAQIAQAERAGAEVVKQPQSVFWGGYSGYFRDPDGFLWELAHNPFMWVGPADD